MVNEQPFGLFTPDFAYLGICASLNCALEIIWCGISCRFWVVKITLLIKRKHAISVSFDYVRTEDANSCIDVAVAFNLMPYSSEW